MLTHEGGQYIRWGRNGKEVFWITLDGGEATPLFQTHIATAGRGAWDVFPDGQRFVIQQAGDRPLNEMTVIVNWQSLLKR